MAWLILFIAGLFETAWAIGMKYSGGFTKVYPTIFTFVAMGFSVFLLSISIKTLPVGTAYAVWTGIGAVGTAIFGIILFGETKEFARLFFIFLIIVGVVGLKIFSKD
ncbi:MAG TPA: quaternary ammonium compound efflux SMR transporter SugE [Ignavibacteriaceae bacterium]|nr:quaternary ammonium compound efflux SMR transporter SugE [Ignavibacteriaceae bacterium]